MTPAMAAVAPILAPARASGTVMTSLFGQIDIQEEQLLEFRGISNIHDPRSGNAYVVRIAYYSQPPVDVPKALPPLGGPEQHELH